MPPLSFFVVLAILLLVALTGLFLKLLKIPKHILGDFVALGAGAMISVAILHIFPEAIETSFYAPFAFAAGFLAIYLFENFLPVHPCVEGECHYHHISILSIISLSFHTIFDGLAVSVAYLTNPALGAVVLAGIAIHQIPVSASLYALLEHTEFSARLKRVLFSVFALSAPLGALLPFIGLGELSEASTALVLAFAGGTLLYVGASDLLPGVHNRTKNRPFVISLFTIGFLLSAVTLFLE